MPIIWQIFIREKKNEYVRGLATNLKKRIKLQLYIYCVITEGLELTIPKWLNSDFMCNFLKHFEDFCFHVQLVDKNGRFL